MSFEVVYTVLMLVHSTTMIIEIDMMVTDGGTCTTACYIRILSSTHMLNLSIPLMRPEDMLHSNIHSTNRLENLPFVTSNISSTRNGLRFIRIAYESGSDPVPLFVLYFPRCGLYPHGKPSSPPVLL